MYSPGTKQRLLARNSDGQVDDVFRPFDMIGADRRVEIAEAKSRCSTSELTGISAARTSAAYWLRSAGVMRPWVEADEEIEAVEADFLCFPLAGRALVWRAEPRRVDEAELPLRIGGH